METMLLLPSLASIEHVLVSMIGPDVPFEWDGLCVSSSLHGL